MSNFWWKSSRAIWGASRTGSKAAQNRVEDLTQQWAINRSRRPASSGVLAPGDPSPAAGGPTDYYDYRGVARWNELATDPHANYGLGSYVDIRKGSNGPIGVSTKVLQRHAAVVGPTGEGKTESVIVPWIVSALREGHSVVAVDVAGDLQQMIERFTQTTGSLGTRVARWDLADAANSISWNWLSDITDKKSVNSAVEAIRGKVSPSDNQPFFHERDLRVLTALVEMTVARRPGATSIDLLRTLRSQDEVKRLVKDSQGLPAATAIPDFLNTANYAEIVSGAINALQIWDEPGLEAITAKDQLRLEGLFDKPSLLIVGAPLTAGRVAHAASSLMLSQIINRLYRRFGKQGQRRVFLVIDEAARLTDRLPFEELLSVSRRAGVSVVLATQDVAQFGDERSTILGNCATYISLPTAFESAADYLMGRLGNRPETATGLSTDARRHGGKQLTHGVIDVPVVGKREILSPPFGPYSAIVHSRPVSAKPFVVDLTRADL